MIVQSAETGHPHFVIASTDHATMALQFAQMFGNETFSALEPMDLMGYVVRNHEAGWEALDQQPLRNPKTGLPYHLSEIPELLHIQKAKLSPVFNEQHHPFCGLLSSMHEWGLYNRRYGLSDKALINEISDENRNALKAFLKDQLDYQGRLKAQLADNPATAGLIEPAKLFHSYKLLEFFDTLALYFNRFHEGSWGTETYFNVPRHVEDDVTVTVGPLRPRTVTVDPWPFRTNDFEVSCVGRYLRPLPEEVDMVEMFRATTMEAQTFVVAAA
jgi:hypothetical protein